MTQPVWYRDTEEFLLAHGKWPITLGLVGLVGVSGYFLYTLWAKEKGAIPAAAWVTYMYMP